MTRQTNHNNRQNEHTKSAEQSDEKKEEFIDERQKSLLINSKVF